MRRILTLFVSLTVCMVATAQLQSQYTPSSYRQLFNGNFSGNYYCCGSTDDWAPAGVGKPYIQMDFGSTNGGGTRTGNGTTTGNNIVAYALGNGVIDLDPITFTITGWSGVWGSTTDNLTLNLNTPTPSSYGLSGGDILNGTLGQYDARYALYIKLTSNNDGFWNNAQTPVGINAGNPNFTLKVTNNTTSAGILRVEFYSGGEIWPGPAFNREFNVPVGTSLLVANDLPAGNIGAINLRTSGLQGQVIFDDLAIGLTRPTVFNSIATSLTSGITTVPSLSLGSSGTFLFDLDGDDLYDLADYVDYSISGTPDIITIDGMGNFTTSGTNTGVFTITARSMVHSPASITKVYTIVNIPVTGYTLSSDYSVLTLDGINNIATLSNTFTPSNATNKEVSFTVSSPNVVLSAVSGNVYATINSPGMYTITGTTTDGGFQSSVVIAAYALSATGISLTVSQNVISVGGSVIATTSLIPEYVLDDRYTITVTGAPGSFSLIQASGNTDTVTGLSAGVITITSTYLANPSIKANRVVTILGAVTSPGTNISAGLLPGEVMVYPNPASGLVSVAAGSATVLSLTLADVAGQVVRSSTSALVSVEGLPQGLYVLIVETSGGTLRKTLIVK